MVKHRYRRGWGAWLETVRRAERGGRAGAAVRWFWRAHDTSATLRRWAALLPEGRVHVVTVPRSRTTPTLRDHYTAAALARLPAAG